MKRAGGSNAYGRFLYAIPITTFGLGLWQTQRLSWKLDLIERTREALIQPPTPIPASQDIDIKRDEFKRVYGTGKFLHDKEVLVGPRPVNGLDSDKTVKFGNVGGYQVITPFEQTSSSGESGEVILVNRGFVPVKKTRDPRRYESPADGIVTIDGWIRRSEGGSNISVKNVPERNEWHTMDVDAISESVGAKPVLMEMLSGSKLNRSHEREGFPILRLPFINMPNNHLQYAITW